MVKILFILLFLGSNLNQGFSNQNQHRSQLLTNEEMRYLASLADSNYINETLHKISIPHLVGMEHHEKVCNYIVEELRSLKWNVQVDNNFTDKHIVATPNPKAPRFLGLACYYDSKYLQNEVSVRAIDSTVPCAMMLEIAKTLSKDFEENKNSSLAIKLFFVDGKEVVENGGPNDFRAKYLGKQLNNSNSNSDMLVLLDWIGHKNPNFFSFFNDTERWFSHLIEIEGELHRLDLLKNHRYNYFQSAPSDGRRIQDDYVPSKDRGVKILYLKNTPFPPESYTPKDDRDIDMDTVTNVNLILKTFISKYLLIFLNQSPEPDRPEIPNENPIPILVVFSVALTFFIYKNVIRQ